VDITAWIVEHVDQTYKQGNWAGRGVLPALAGVTTEESAWRPHPEQKTIGEIIRHMAYWKDAVSARTSGEPWESSEEANWRPVAATARGLEEARAELQQAHERLLRVLRSFSPERLNEVVWKAWWLEEGQARVIDWAVGAAHHDMYHAAQIFVLRRLYQQR
jgi:uncharacterized damage-inducible protein DinB